MRNPNDVTFNTRTTSDSYITEYGYTSASSTYFADIARMRELYGQNNVTTNHRERRYWIIVSQPLFPEAASRPFKTESF